MSEDVTQRRQWLQRDVDGPELDGLVSVGRQLVRQGRAAEMADVGVQTRLTSCCRSAAAPRWSRWNRSARASAESR